MARSQEKARRKPSGGRLSSNRSKRKNELAGYQANTKLSEEKRVRINRVIGGNTKQSLLTVKTINVSDKKGKVTKSDILNVLENSANPHLVRRNIITKGAVVETKLGKVRITSRPGQAGSLSGVLV